MTASRKPAPKTAKQRMQSRRDRLREQGLRPVQHWVPDLRDPKVQAELQKEIANLANHPENAVIDAWVEANTDWSDWR